MLCPQWVFTLISFIGDVCPRWYQVIQCFSNLKSKTAKLRHLSCLCIGYVSYTYISESSVAHFQSPDTAIVTDPILMECIGILAGSLMINIAKKYYNVTDCYIDKRVFLLQRIFCITHMRCFYVITLFIDYIITRIISINGMIYYGMSVDNGSHVYDLHKIGYK